MIQDLLEPRFAGLPGDSLNLQEPDAVVCPLCRRPVPRPDRCRDGSRPLAECPPCDLLFDVADAAATARIP